MTRKINLIEYGSIISDKAIGEKIYLDIRTLLNGRDNVLIDFSSVISMATFNAKQIFGRLYLELGSEAFFDKIDLKNASPDIKLIIRMGIKNALDEKNDNPDVR